MDRHLWYYRFKADVSWLESFIEDIERTDTNLVTSLVDSTGVGYGFTVTERAAGQNFSVDIAAGNGYDESGKRIYSADVQNLPFVEDESAATIEVVGVGNERIVSIYAVYALVDDAGSSVVDGFGDTVFTIQTEEVTFELYQGTEAGAGLAVAAARPAGDRILLADVTIRYGDTTIADADIDESVKEYLGIVIGTNSVGESEIDWGFGANQVSAVDIPVADAGTYFTGTEIETILQEIGAEIASGVSDLSTHMSDTSTHGVTVVAGLDEVQTFTQKTLVTPTIASFINATHNHQDAAGGGGLDAALAITSGTLPVTRGGTGTTTSTGSGSVVLSSSPTIVTPTIASFANSNHNHENSAGGGTLSAAAIASGTLAVARGGTGTTTSTGTGSTVLNTSPVLTTPAINNPALTFQYNFAGSAIVADRTVTLPLLTAGDTFVMAAFTQTLTNKTLTSPTISGGTFSGNPSFTGSPTFSDEILLPAIDPPTANYANRNSIVKGWGHYYQPTNTLYDSYNVASVTDNSTGDYDVDWDTNFINEYACVASNLSGVSRVSNTTGVANILTYNMTPVLADARGAFIAIGDQ